MEEKASSEINAFQELGGIEGVRALANCFYDVMEVIPEARKIREMHPVNLAQTRENLFLFLCGWLGGPPLYLRKYGRINLTELHAHLDIDTTERDMWLSCMKQALNRQEVADDLKEQLLNRFQVPAEKIRSTCQEKLKGLPFFSPGNISK